MCDPMTMMAASFAISAATTVTEHIAQAEQAQQHNTWMKQNQEAAQANLNQEYTALQTRQIQEEDAAAVEKQAVSREARAARAASMVSAGEAGVSGLTVDALLADIYGREAEYKDRVNQNTGFTTANLQAEMRGSRARAQDRINSIQPMNGPSPIASALKIGGAGLSSFGSYKKWTA